ncbi:MAG: methyltransferase domain-containing protein [Acidobacteria bacterium]|nr:methyltransferase domain-containing protein [Acidobacteriota bacterium]NIM61492.1 methyltransferase domain-containing protein [Acidobacteriota bacterium]NIO58124.1 methyltransferase domain-containing protein [Acidobacteriota bacterium]NIQ29136.1 methyltransferase domain-containing protein [Acidobacteriota bacterium]NIQ83687.1 methyltransferase domain-containing protein [Acidobacteriota bacterium]
MPRATYELEAYRAWQDPSARSAAAVVPRVLEWIRPRSVIDVGCGLGMWAKAFSDAGVPHVHGMDSPDVPTAELLIPEEDFVAVDLSRPVETTRRYDLVVSLEVAEHLPASAARTFVETLTALGPVVLFSAAIPYQRGANHVNEQWPEYWARLFADRGYRAIDCLRRLIWNDESVEPYYCQNAILYIAEDRLVDFPALAAEALPPGNVPLSLIHPHYYIKRSSFQDTSLKWWGFKARHYASAILRRLRILPRV